MNKAKIDKYIEYGITKIKLMYKERKFHHDGTTLKYLLEKNKNSNDLIVVFSGIPRPGIKARYNYGKTLSKVKSNRLFILDDFGFDQRGNYYLGKDKDFNVERAVLSLIDSVKESLSINKTIYCGSSKGGWAAIYYGVREPKSKIIAGSLQYLLGNYITSNERRSYNIMSYVMGKNFDESDIKYLNNLLRQTIFENKNKGWDLKLHYSVAEYTYNDHMIYLLKDLDDFNIEYDEDVQNYKSHGELSLYFPPFLLKSIEDFLNEENDCKVERIH
ncbi:hypothetical protein [Gracilibacillus alcaliphilus]|uniref:hypothetical protein n=1 Tax=Gracilibacillus alcaliphilus TaxID=1401441 RepID=UPI0019584DB1|nr:hypothetical protein [Gracilibacillus alcaliphilus]MBM7678372.1 hypothetical protein [Gracilibacillus alcaliphilus]